MAQFRSPNPYDPHFALPDNVLAEPPGRGTITTAQLPRRTMGFVPKDWDGGFALPNYIRAEPHGRGTAISTYQARRKTIPFKIPESLAGIEEMYAHPAMQAAGMVGAVAGAYHGYKRNNSIAWALVWSVLGGSMPFFTIPVSVAQGFGKRKKR